MRDIVLEHQRRYPCWKLDDLYKLVHQAALGSEHTVTDEARARAWLTQEMAKMGLGPHEPLIEPISPDGEVVRVHLRPYLRRRLDPELLLEAFVRTAEEFRGLHGRIDAGLAEAGRLAREGRLPFTETDIALLSARMRAEGFPAVHHSDVYVAEYHPAYRVISRASMAKELQELSDGGEATSERSS
ncbi:MAG: hypothetical protein ABFD77_08735 [Thermotogota bacterium]